MYKYFLESHLKKIGKYQDALVFYKGFPENFLEELNQSYPRFYQGNSQSGKGLDTIALEASAKKVQAKFLSLEEGIYWGIYEEYVLLSNRFQDLNDSYDGSIIIVENNFFNNEYPVNFSPEMGQAVLAYVKYIESEEENIEPSEDVKILLNYYGYITTRSAQHYCSYVNKEDHNSNVINKKFFDNYKPINREAVKAASPKYENDYIFPNYLDDSFYQLKESLHFGEYLYSQGIDIVLESTVFRDEYLKDEISILNHVCNNLGAPINLFLSKPQFTLEYRPELLSILKRYWDTNASFRELTFYEDPDATFDIIKISQGALIEDIVKQCEIAKEGNHEFKDIFITAPTGAGKSVLFQIPAIYLAEKHQKWMTIIVTPLIALMHDQVEALKDRGIDYCAFINSELSLDQREYTLEGIRDGSISILYLSPELLLSNDIRNFLGERQIGLMVIDEAHLITTWGRDFRVDYWYLGNFINKIRKYELVNDFPVLALTATAVYHGPDDMVLETIDSLYMKNPKIYLGTVRRDEISFKIISFKEKGSHEDLKIQRTIERIKEFVDNDEKTIIYFPWVSQIKDVLTNVDSQYRSYVGTYYGQLDAYSKEELMGKFKNGNIKVMLATKAFGMGVDISDINIVYHHAPSGNLCDYVQEIGRVARDKNIKGLAKVDFHANDLKFARILYGLSSMKQYQLNFMLKKIHDIYKRNKKQNFLVSPEAFSYIFDQKDDIEQKVKSGLLLIEKDLLKRYGYPVVLVRPRSLFSKCYACVPASIGEQFLKSKFAKYAVEVSDIDQNCRFNSGNFGSNEYMTKDVGCIYELDLKAIWENHFESLSFPQVKKLFFDKELFDFSEPVYPRFRFSIELIDLAEKVKAGMEKYFELLKSCFTEISGKYFARQELISLLNYRLKNEVLARKIANIMLNLFVTDVNWGESGRTFNNEEFIQKKTTEKGDVYRVIDRAYYKLKGRFLRTFNDLFQHSQSDYELLKYISYGDVRGNHVIKLAYLLEAMELGTYELSGGKNPEIFIRINDPYKVRVMVQRNEYSNAILTDVDRRQKKSIDIMRNFFAESYEDIERWDMIENYFLGREVLE
ncbi:DEAD/DEAH box helicase [Phosphitispora fastidiosa]|uniref:DEAD/DEAH box helicase n=1 Tax=Phosphitispora fastidiosa TaxID=2837202 RepID=UPI001E2C4192|nr:DEAD/DEAH box helicase [Phosphitispora fastidiosa]MBU7005207.1 RecQ family ATP-dependent DNA helicase [Phosphitispora fastidiosa]